MSVFTRKGYIAIAKALRDEPGLNKAGREQAVRALVKVFKADNPAFAEAVFRAVANSELEDDRYTKDYKIGEY
jgi:hypothetical protein